MQIDETFHIAPLVADEADMPGGVGPLSFLESEQ
jgi:hypothetical protein